MDFADIFVKDVKTKIWDLAPGDLLLRELSSEIINLKGERIDYSNLTIEDGIICTRNLELSNRIQNIYHETNQEDSDSCGSSR